MDTLAPNNTEGNIFLNSGFASGKPVFHSPYIISPSVPFELRRLPDRQIKKQAYNRLFDSRTTDFEIELSFIQRYEIVSSPRATQNVSLESLEYFRSKLKHHYHRAIAILSPKMSAGWNRWSEEILDLFICNKLHRVLWGSGGCSKSSVMGLLLYIKWRVNPANRMVVLATRVVKEAKFRVFAYISELHAGAPPSSVHRIAAFTGQDSRGIYVQFQDPNGKWVNHERGCILSLPVKVDADRMTIGDNLIGPHPDDTIDLGFDECQELPGRILEERIFFNWLSNPRVSVHSWGNPNPVAFHETQAYDLLFRLGVGKLTEQDMRAKELNLDKDDSWEFEDTKVVRLSTMNSPKDDPEEAGNYYNLFGVKTHRLEFLAGKNSIDQLVADTPKHSAAYYSQIYGFPFIDYAGESSKGVLSPRIVQNTQNYPLLWRTAAEGFEYFMGVDSAPTGMGDDCSIAVGKRGLMMDGRVGADIMHGRHCYELRKDENDTREFTDVVIDEMLRVARELRIPLRNIGVETHSSGEVLKYALQKSIEEGKWGSEWRTGGKFFTVSPVIAPTDRHIFKELGKFFPAEDIVTDINTEYYLSFRCGVMTRQIFNIPDATLNQFYNRRLLMNSNNTKYKIETKAEMKKRGVKSPNRADAICNMLEVMRQQGKFNFKFRTTGGYDAYFTPEREQMMQDFQLKTRLGRASQLLGLSADMSVYAGPQRSRLSGIDEKESGGGDFNCVSV